MALSTPTTVEISATIIAQLEATLNQTIPLLPRSFIRVLAAVLGAVFIRLYKYGGFIFLQMFVSKATIELTDINGNLVSPLKEWGRLIGVGDPVAAVNAELILDVTVLTQTGVLNSGTQLIGVNNGVTYITLAAIALDAPTVQITVKAVQDQAGGGGRGAIGNLPDGDDVSFANALGNVQRITTVNTTTVTGVDEESTAAYRQRIIDRFGKQPQGGALADYELWGEEAAGIINVYPYTGDPGEIDVFSEATVESSGSPDGIPTASQLQSVLDLINFDENGLANRRPANAFVNSNAIIRTSFDIDVEGLLVDDPVQTQADITAGVEQYFLERAPFINGLTLPPRTDRITQSGIIGLVEDIVTAVNGTFTTATFKETVGPVIESYDLGRGEKAKANEVTFS